MLVGPLVTLLLLSEAGPAVAARSAVSAVSAAGSWESDGARVCMFDEDDLRERACTQYHSAVEHRTASGQRWTKYRWKWTARNGLEVRYISRIGSLGISVFTIGDLFDRNSGLQGGVSHNAVSYAPSREELVIGVPGEGYQFSVKGCCT